jgi:hypothetical protein
VITLTKMITRDVITKEKVYPPQYEIRDDDRLIGHLPFEPGSRPLLFVRVGPIEQEQIRNEIEKLLPAGHGVGPVAIPPVPPREPPQDEDDLDPYTAIERDQA